jgi:hypothetical protein
VVEEELRRFPSQGWAAIDWKIYDVDPMIFSKSGGRMKVVAFIREVAVVERIIDHLSLPISSWKMLKKLKNSFFEK